MMFKVGMSGGQPVFFETSIVVDDWGCKQTMCAFVKRRPDGTRTRVLIATPFKVTNYSRNTAIMPPDQTVEISKAEAKGLFNENKAMIDTVS